MFDTDAEISASIMGPFGDNGHHQELNIQLKPGTEDSLVGATNQLSARSQICFTAQQAGNYKIGRTFKIAKDVELEFEGNVMIRVQNNASDKLYSIDGVKAVLSNIYPSWNKNEIVSTGADFITLKTSGTLKTDVMIDS